LEYEFYLTRSFTLEIIKNANSNLLESASKKEINLELHKLIVFAKYNWSKIIVN
jgi:hypothetical protein